MFNPHYPVQGLRGAEYNPRIIDEESLVMLRESIKNIGVAKPIIVTDGGLIIAGHQRTKAFRALGYDTVPAYLLKKVSMADEVRFNQLHNGTDMDVNEEDCLIVPGTGQGYEEIQYGDIDANMRTGGAELRRDICNLITRYGPWGAAVANQSGAVISGAQYAISCKALKIPCRIYRVPDHMTSQAVKYFSRTYGRFNYDHLERNTYAQSFAQPFRLRWQGRGFASKTYESLLLPVVSKTDRILDFGCGQADYVKALRKEGYRIQGVEFFHRKGNLIDTKAVHRMCDELFAEIRANGLFDVVICDYVINSVDTLQAEIDVMTCINAFAKPGGRVFFSGRSLEGALTNVTRTQSYARHLARRSVEFLDENGFSAMFRDGQWNFQKFHSRAQVEELWRTYITPEPPVKFHYGESQFRVSTFKSIELPREQVLTALRNEFDLMWPAGRRVGKADQAIEAWTKAIQ